MTRKGRHPKPEIETALRHAEAHGWIVDALNKRPGAVVLAPEGAAMVHSSCTPWSTI